MSVKIIFKGPLVKALGTSEVRIDVTEAVSLREVLTKVIDKFSDIRKVWPTPELIDREALILQNGMDIALIEGLETNLNAGDSVTILPLIHGGAKD